MKCVILLDLSIHLPFLSFAGCGGGGTTLLGSTFAVESNEFAKEGAPWKLLGVSGGANCTVGKEVLDVAAGAMVVVAVLPGTVVGAWVPNGNPVEP